MCLHANNHEKHEIKYRQIKMKSKIKLTVNKFAARSSIPGIVHSVNSIGTWKKLWIAITIFSLPILSYIIFVRINEFKSRTVQTNIYYRVSASSFRFLKKSKVPNMMCTTGLTSWKFTSWQYRVLFRFIKLYQSQKWKFTMTHDLQKTQYIILCIFEIFGHFEFSFFWIDTTL